MSGSKDRELGMHRNITRRDFVNGVGVAIGGLLIAPGWISARERTSHASQAQEYYPPIYLVPRRREAPSRRTL